MSGDRAPCDRAPRVFWEPSSSDTDSDEEGGPASEAGRPRSQAAHVVSRAEMNEADDEVDEDAAWAAKQGPATNDSDSEEDDKPWTNFRKSHRLTEIAVWKTQKLGESLLVAIRQYSARTVGKSVSQVNDAISPAREDLKQLGLDIFYLSDGYCVGTANFDEAEQYRAIMRKAAEAKRKASGLATRSRSSLVQQMLLAKQQAQLHDQALHAPSTNGNDAGRNKNNGSGGGGGSNDCSASGGGAKADPKNGVRSHRGRIPHSALPLSLSEEEHRQFLDIGTNGPEWQFSLGDWGEDRSMDAFDELLAEGWTMQLYAMPSAKQKSEVGASLPDAKTADTILGTACSEGKRSDVLLQVGAEVEAEAVGMSSRSSSSSTSTSTSTSTSSSGRPRRDSESKRESKHNLGKDHEGQSTKLLDLSYAASWWQDGAPARVHRRGSHVHLELGLRKCLPVVEEALLMVPIGMCAEIVVGPLHGASFSLFGPEGVTFPAKEGDYLLCRVKVHGFA